MTWGALSGCTIGCRPRGSSAKLQCFSQNADITGCPESRCRCSLLKSQTWCVKRAMLQPLGLPLCLPSHLLASIRLNTFLHPYLPPKKSLLHKASLAAHLLHLPHISIVFSLSRSYHQCPLPPHQLIILSPGLIFGKIVKKSRDVLATSGDSAGIMDRGFIRRGKCDLGSSLRKCAGFLAILFTGRPPRSIVLFPSETRARVFTMGKSL